MLNLVTYEESKTNLRVIILFLYTIITVTKIQPFHLPVTEIIMDNNVQKRSLFEVYLLEEEEISDVDKLQEKFESGSTISSLNSEDSNEKREVFSLEIGDEI